MVHLIGNIVWSLNPVNYGFQNGGVPLDWDDGFGPGATLNQMFRRSPIQELSSGLMGPCHLPLEMNYLIYCKKT